MIDGTLQSMIDEVLISIPELFGSPVAPGRFERHLG
jgi:hypothetical protein